MIISPEISFWRTKRPFGRPSKPGANWEKAIAVYATNAAERMRRQRLVAENLQALAETTCFRPGDPQYAASTSVHLPVDTARLIRASQTGVSVLYRATV